jgi:chromosome partitioning protein
MRMRTITICQRKGGVGKSSATLSLAYALSERGAKVLVADLDDQQNTTGSITHQATEKLTVEDLLLEKGVCTAKVVVKTTWPGVWLLPSSPLLSGVIKYLDSEVGGHLLLSEKLKEVEEEFDYCLIDNGGALNILVINSLCASRYLFIPLSSHLFSLSGISDTLKAYHKVKARLNPALTLLGMAFVIHDRRSSLAGEIVERVRSEYPHLLFSTTIGVNIKIEEAQLKRESIFSYAPADRGAGQYRSLCEELLKRLSRLEGGEGVDG